MFPLSCHLNRWSFMWTLSQKLPAMTRCLLWVSILKHIYTFCCNGNIRAWSQATEHTKALQNLDVAWRPFHCPLKGRAALTDLIKRLLFSSKLHASQRQSVFSWEPFKNSAASLPFCFVSLCFFFTAAPSAECGPCVCTHLSTAEQNDSWRKLRLSWKHKRQIVSLANLLPRHIFIENAATDAHL